MNHDGAVERKEFKTFGGVIQELLAVFQSDWQLFTQFQDSITSSATHAPPAITGAAIPEPSIPNPAEGAVCCDY